MTLPALTLDDLTYEDLRDMAMRRIPAASGGRWTHHEPVDAGVTLLELFAFLLEQQLFVLDQVPDGLTHAILALFDEEVAGAGVARTLVAPPDGSVTAPRVLPDQTPIDVLGGGKEALAFSTEGDTLLLPVTQTTVFADGVTLSESASRRGGLPVMATADGALIIDLALSTPIPASALASPMTLAIILDASGVAAEWEARAGDVPPPTVLQLDWATDAAEGRISDWQDGTGGLRRSGLLRFRLPEAAVGGTQLRLTLSGDGTGFAVPPMLRNARLGATVAAHSRMVSLDADVTDPALQNLYQKLRAQVIDMLPNSGQTLSLPDALGPVLAPSIALALQDRDGVFHVWTRAADMTSSEPEARVFTFDRASNVLAFGDGYAGRVPGPAGDLRLSLHVGGGQAGNHAAGMMWRVAGSDQQLISLADANDGAEAETLTQARARVASAITARERAVTKDDYITLVETTPGIAAHRAHVAPMHEPGFACIEIADSVTVFVVPHSSAAYPAPVADEGALTAIRDRLDRTRMLTTRVFVARPVLRPVAITVEISSGAGTQEDFLAQLRPILTEYLHPTLGGPLGTGWPFGAALRPSELRRVADRAMGETGRVGRVALRLTDMPDSTAEDCTAVAIGPNDLVRLDRLSVTLSIAGQQEVTL